MKRVGTASAAIAVLLSVLPACAAAPPRLELEPCQIPEVKAAARCGTWEVFEDRAAGQGRRIGLRVVVVPARSQPALPDPIVFFEGGPGASVIGSAQDILDENAGALEHRDLLLVDARGTGGSHPLRCPKREGEGAIEQTLDTFMDPEGARSCRDLLAKDSDLAQYTTDATADDVDEVRAVLGYKKVNLMGASYGTRAALVYLRRHPESVRTVVLASVLPTDGRIPMFLAPQTQAAFDGVAAACAAEASCHAAFPDPKGDLDAALGKLAAGPVEVSLHDAEGVERRLRLSRNGAVQTVRYLLYQPGGVRRLPLFLHRAAGGDFGPLGQSAWDIASGLMASGASGLYLSVTCAEDVAFVDREEAERLAAGTFVGDFRLRQQLAACAEWPAAKVPATFLEPVRSTVPVLIFAGENDPGTPLDWARKVAGTLANSRLMVVPGGAHTFYDLVGNGCIDRVTSAFVIQGSAEGLDLEGCRAAIRRYPFITSLEEKPGS